MCFGVERTWLDALNIDLEEVALPPPAAAVAVVTEELAPLELSLLAEEVDEGDEVALRLAVATPSLSSEHRVIRI